MAPGGFNHNRNRASAGAGAHEFCRRRFLFSIRLEWAGAAGLPNGAAWCDRDPGDGNLAESVAAGSQRWRASDIRQRTIVGPIVSRVLTRIEAERRDAWRLSPAHPERCDAVSRAVTPGRGAVDRTRH